jgi:hypothetical protein
MVGVFLSTYSDETSRQGKIHAFTLNTLITCGERWKCASLCLLIFGFCPRAELLFGFVFSPISLCRSVCMHMDVETG